MNELKKYYRFTSKEKIESILDYERLTNNGYGIYVCECLEDVLQFVHFRVPVLKKDRDNNIIGQIFINDEDIRIIEFMANPSYFQESFDHNSKFMNGARAWVSHDEIVEIKIVNIYNLK